MSVRRKLRVLAKDRIIFLDETHIRETIHPTTTLALKGDKGKVLVQKPEAFAARLDIIAAATSEETLPLGLFGPKDRKRLGSKGITKAMFNGYMADTLGPAIAGLNTDCMKLVVDGARIHNLKEIEQALDNAGADNVEEIVLLPKEVAKHVSPLDNALFHDFKEAVRDRVKNERVNMPTLKRRVRKMWASIKPEKLEAHYRKSRLYKHQPLTDDLDDLH